MSDSQTISKVPSSAADAMVLRQFVEGLLDSYLTWAADFLLQERISDLSKLPTCCADWISRVNETRVPWVAWQTQRGLVIATGIYDHDQSRRTASWVIFIDWSLLPAAHNGSWWRSDPRRPREWTAGRGRG